MVYQTQLQRDQPKSRLYQQLVGEVAALLDGERDFWANTANAVALIFHGLPGVNWVGVYVLRGSELVLGPFQGKPACVRIPLGRGVCGTAAQRGRTVVVTDVHAFEGHIACDPESRSEIVVPLLHGGHLVGVLDLDSPLAGRFDDEDRAGLEQVAAALLERIDRP
jgi:GAF domain-containing protein